MKFYTIEWWCGIQSGDASDPMDAFREYLDSIRDRLPSDLLVLQDSVSLHDARMHLFSHDASRRTLSLTLHGDDGSGGLRVFPLLYHGVVAHRFSSDPDVGLPGPNGFGDLGYDEPDVLSDDLFQHRLLFSSGIELQVDFSNFKLEYRDHRGG